MLTRKVEPVLPETMPTVSAEPTILSKLSDFEGMKASLLESNVLSHLRPVHEFVNKNAFSIPKSSGEVAIRVTQNAQYYWANYITLATALLCFTIFTQPMVLLILVTAFFADNWMSKQEEVHVFQGMVLKGSAKSFTVLAASVLCILLSSGSAILAVLVWQQY